MLSSLHCNLRHDNHRTLQGIPISLEQLIQQYLEGKMNHFSSTQHHWRRLVKNIGVANPNFGVNVVKTDKCMGGSLH